jgi:hypothetical protein
MESVHIAPNGIHGLQEGIEPHKESTVVIDKEFDAVRADKLFKDFYKDIPPEDEDTRLFYYTEPHVGSDNKMGLFGDYAPSIVFSANNHQDLHLPFRESTLNEFAYSKLCHLYCTLDKSIMFHFYNRHMAQSKVFNLNSVATILGHPELGLDVEPLKESGVSEKDILAIVFQVKRNATKLLKYVEVTKAGIETKTEQPHAYGYPVMLEKLFGTNLDSIILYGSSANGQGNDFDNIVVLKRLPLALYDKIHDLKPRENEKEVGIIFVPEYAVEKFLYINVSNTLFRENAKVLKGKVDFPIESERYTEYKEFYHAGFGSGKLISALNLVYRNPQILLDKAGLFEYFMKLNRFTYNGLLQQDGYVIKSKEEILSDLKSNFDYEIPKFRPDVKYLQEMFLYANAASVAIAKKMYHPKKAQESNEKLLTMEEQVGSRTFRSHLAGKPGKTVYVFKGEELVRPGDVVPVQIMTDGDYGYKSRMNTILYKGLEKKKDFLVGKRV